MCDDRFEFNDGHMDYICVCEFILCVLEFELHHLLATNMLIMLITKGCSDMSPRHENKNTVKTLHVGSEANSTDF